MKILLNQLDCTIVVSPGSLKQLASHILNIRKKYSSVVIIADETTHKLHGEAVQQQITQLNIPCHEITIPDGENSKSLATAESCWTKMLDFKVDKNGLVLALGGGVVIDIAGYVASCYMRGIDFMSIPTTLVGMIDAAISGNNGVNLVSKLGEGQIGTIHYPKLVLVDSQFLTTLPFLHLQNGLVRAIKYSVAHDFELFTLLEKSAKDILKGKLAPLAQIVERACDIKADILRRSLRQQDVQDALYWGCTLGKALKTATKNTLLDGESIAIGMCCEAHLSYQMGLVDQVFVDRHEALCSAYNLPTKLPKGIASDELLPLIPAAETEAGKYTFILAHKIGKVSRQSHISKDDLLKILLSQNASVKHSLKR